MQQDKNIGIIGAGGQAREVAQYLKSDGVPLAFFAVHLEYLTTDSSKIDLLSPSEDERAISVVAAIGSPGLRRKLVEEWSGENFTNIITRNSYVGGTVKMGVGCIVSPFAVLTTDVSLGDHILINTGATVSHDCKLGDYATISPGAHIAGNVDIGRGVFVGIGATISNGVKIAEGSVIGAGAVVLHDVLEENSVVVGVPAKTIRLNEGWLDEL